MTIEGHECWLVDDGTLDTVISIDGEDYRFSTDYASAYRDENGDMTESGFSDLCMEVIEDL